MKSTNQLRDAENAKIVWGGQDTSIIPLSTKQTSRLVLPAFKKRPDMEAARASLQPMTPLTVNGKTWMVAGISVKSGWRKTPKSRRRIWKITLKIERYL